MTTEKKIDPKDYEAAFLFSYFVDSCHRRSECERDDDHFNFRPFDSHYLNDQANKKEFHHEIIDRNFPIGNENIYNTNLKTRLYPNDDLRQRKASLKLFTNARSFSAPEGCLSFLNIGKQTMSILKHRPFFMMQGKEPFHDEIDTINSYRHYNTYINSRVMYYDDIANIFDQNLIKSFEKRRFIMDNQRIKAQMKKAKQTDTEMMKQGETQRDYPTIRPDCISPLANGGLEYKSYINNNFERIPYNNNTEQRQFMSSNSTECTSPISNNFKSKKTTFNNNNNNVDNIKPKNDTDLKQNIKSKSNLISKPLPEWVTNGINQMPYTIIDCSESNSSLNNKLSSVSEQQNSSVKDNIEDIKPKDTFTNISSKNFENFNSPRMSNDGRIGSKHTENIELDKKNNQNTLKNIPGFICAYCKEKFSTKKDLVSHLLELHDEQHQ